MMKKIKIQYTIFPLLCFCFLVFGIGDVSATLTPDPSGGGSATFHNPLRFSSVEGFLGNVLTTIQSIVAILAVLMIVIGGILYITSAGDQGRIQIAKTTVTAAIIGLAIAIAAPTFLREIYAVLGAPQPAAAAGARSLSQILLSTLQVLLGIIGTLSVLMLVIGGILYITSAGDPGRVEAARKTIQYAIIGLVVAILSLVIVSTVASVL